ncbi:hypothetical protein Q5H93_21105 [Hymenobacter sp. ASUV-10]|uniref:Uncharacterized protein n=1 Tax=Hymenobacter aranciens TaxID=3063996 RepID=A0ABT9BL40_9BACT|nr:hypothetical protein [Hymenobacter sp. ASUV-10]MDO7877258.1 hypothetical protein [Hymenobacter sp. ASUV-10]
MQQPLSVACTHCQNIFHMRPAEHQRSLKLGRRMFCSRSCAGRSNQRNLPPAGNPAAYSIKQHAANRKDKYSGLREHLRHCRRRDKETTISLDDLLAQWQHQQGHCPFTGIELQHPEYIGRNDVFRNALLDRIDPSLGYVLGNIQSVSMAINYAKSTLSQTEMVDLCKLIARYRQSKV